MDSLDGYMCYDHLLYQPMREIGWKVKPVSWRNREVNWDDFEIVIVRSPWDYQSDPEKFLEVLEAIHNSKALLENDINIIRENINKLYLKSLQSCGLDIVPSIFADSLKLHELLESFQTFSAQEIIVKPLISANAADTFRLSRGNERALICAADFFCDRPCLIQPFMDAIVTEGEYSLFFFDGEYSHTILKTPQQNDFRVQEEHGGTLHLIQPEPRLQLQAHKTMEVLTPLPLYARVDLVRHADTFCIMELELIEPSLYFNMDPRSPERFTTAFARKMQRISA